MTRGARAWRRVSRRHRCPVCGRGDWCLVAGDPCNPRAAICARTESARRVGEAGWLHRLRDDGDRRSRRRTIRAAAPGAMDVVRLELTRQVARFQQAVDPDALGRLADRLGLSVDSLVRLRIGWSNEHSAWSFPMTDAAGKVVGVRLRLPGGRKLAVRGGHEGLFIPSNLDTGGQLLIAEGPTDTAALLDLSFAAIGRPSCAGGVKLLVDFCRRREPSEVVIVADGDEPGKRGAESLAVLLTAYSKAVRIIIPPTGAKDARKWKQGGATRHDIQQFIDAAPVRRLPIHSRKVGRKNHG